MPNAFWGIVVHGGEKTIPAFDVNIFIEPTGKCDEMQRWTMRDVMNTGVNDVRIHYFPAVAPAMALSMRVRFEPTCNDAYYLAYIYTRNRVALQQIILSKKDGRWLDGYRVIDVETGNELFLHVADGLTVTWPELTDIRGKLRALADAGR